MQQPHRALVLGQRGEFGGLGGCAGLAAGVETRRRPGGFVPGGPVARWLGGFGAWRVRAGRLV
ncbi:hypothetical protein EAO69_43495 [Streptomyces sp. me109]|nr:hypothetical protein EAO69_43495 [Streptomyces sp. me109]